jgi:hypothetical protein
LHRMGSMEEANTAFSACLTLYDNFSKGWLSWGYFCDHQFMELADPKDMNNPTRMAYAENAVNCCIF